LAKLLAKVNLDALGINQYTLVTPSKSLGEEQDKQSQLLLPLSNHTTINPDIASSEWYKDIISYIDHLAS